MARRFDRWSSRGNEGITNDFNKFIAKLEDEFNKVYAAIPASSTTATVTSTTTGTFIPSGGGGPQPPPSNPGTLVPFEIPSGSINSSNVTFTVASTPIPNQLFLIRNGVLQLPGTDYVLGGSTITFAVAPNAGDAVWCYYWTI